MVDLRVVIIADDPLARAGLALLLGEQPGCRVVGQLAGSRDLDEALPLYRPDVLVWDWGWGEAAEKLAAAAELDDPDLPVVLLLPDDEMLTAVAWASGARGLIRRDSQAAQIAAAVTAVSQKLLVVDPAFAAVFQPGSHPATLGSGEDLTPRERDVLQLLAEGMTNKAIAHRLAISDHTVKFHVNAILSKLNAQSRTEAVVKATRLGLLLL